MQSRSPAIHRWSADDRFVFCRRARAALAACRRPLALGNYRPEAVESRVIENAPTADGSGGAIERRRANALAVHRLGRPSGPLVGGDRRRFL
jgi:hypothetical protein